MTPIPDAPAAATPAAATPAAATGAATPAAATGAAATGAAAPASPSEDLSTLGLTAEMMGDLRRAGLDTPRRVFDMMNNLTGATDEQSRQMLRDMSRTSSGVNALRNMIQAADHFHQGQHVEGVSRLMDGLASAWPLLPDNMRQRMADRLGDTLERIPNMRGFAQMIPEIERIGGTPGLLQMAAGALRNDGQAVEQGFRSILGSLSNADMRTAGALGTGLITVLNDILPASAMAKMGARKVPLVSLGVAAWDLGSAAINGLRGNGEQALRDLAGAASGVAGTIPGWGTAASIAIDLGLVAGDVAASLGRLQNVSLQMNPFASS